MRIPQLRFRRARRNGQGGAIEKDLASAFEGVDVVLTHDIIYQPSAVKHLIASKRIARRNPKMRWLHWIHSATSPYTLQNLRPLFVDQYVKEIQDEFPNSFYIFFNDYSRYRVAKNFNVGEEKVKIVHHPTDLKAFYKIEDQSWQIMKRKKMLDADVICMYAIRLDRGKQVEKVIKTIGAFKQLGKKVRSIIGDLHSSGGDKVTYREELKKTAKEWGLHDMDIGSGTTGCQNATQQEDGYETKHFFHGRCPSGVKRIGPAFATFVSQKIVFVIKLTKSLYKFLNTVTNIFW